MFWIPTERYKRIVDKTVPTVARGSTTRAFVIPEDLWMGLDSATGIITIPMAFICPDWTLVISDHQAMMNFHIMRMEHICSQSDFDVGSPVWFLLYETFITAN